MKCLILAAGYATRLYPLTKNFPKPLLKVGNKTIIDYLIDDLVLNCNIIDFVIVSNHKFIKHFNSWKIDKLKSCNCNIELVDDGTTSNETRLGAIKDIKYAIDKLNIDDDLLIMAGDNLLDFSLNGFVNYYYSIHNSCVMYQIENELMKKQKTAIIEIDSNNKITSYEEKPLSPKSNLAVPPFYIYRKQDIKYIDEALNSGCNFDAPGSYAAWLSNKVDMYAYPMPGKRYDIGDTESYNQANKCYNCENGIH